jgi:nucleotide-binding universal stress UspA family protein
MTKRFRHLLHASDFSPASQPAFGLAVALARSQRAALTIMHVMAPVVPVIGDAYVSPQTWTDLQRQVRAYAQRELDKLLDRARRAGVRAQGLLVEGPPADRIVRAARSRRADLIVMGTHGRGGLARLFLGSVAERVVATAPCPVLTVRGR